MEMLDIQSISSIEWKPSPVVALATCTDKSQVAVARGDRSLEIWLVASGAVGWHCQLTIQGKPGSTISSLVWCCSGSKSTMPGRLFSSSIDGSISEWDLFSLKEKIVLESSGGSIWQMAAEPWEDSLLSSKHSSQVAINGNYSHRDSVGDDDETKDSDDDDNDGGSVKLHDEQTHSKHQRFALACDDGCVRICSPSESDERLMVVRLLPRVKGRILSVAWSLDAKFIFAGGTDGSIRCWDVISAREVYRITAGIGRSASGTELCICALLVLRGATLVSGDSTGSVQFWDSRNGTLVQTHSCHKGDVNALIASPSHQTVFSAGSDGQIILFKLSNGSLGSGNNEAVPDRIEKWDYVDYKRVHTHDVRALTVAVPIIVEDKMPEEKKRARGPEKPLDFSYCKWAHHGVPMLISGGDDTKLYAYPVSRFFKYNPHDICPAPQRLSIHLVLSSCVDGAAVILVQYPDHLDVLLVQFELALKRGKRKSMDSERPPLTQLLARVKCKASQKIISSAISGSGALIAYSDHVKPSLFELKKPYSSGSGRNAWVIDRRQLPRILPSAHYMVFNADSSILIVAGHDRKIYVVDVESGDLLHTFIPFRKEVVHDASSLTEPPVTRLCTSSDGQWLAAMNCFGDIYIFNLEIHRAMCLIDFGAPVNGEEEGLPNGSTKKFESFYGNGTAKLTKLKRASFSACHRNRGKENFAFKSFVDPVHFVGYVSEGNVLVIDKPWLEVVQTFEAPVHRHIYGT
ncbi:U3 small nucleolar RNA-associated protein 4 homolog isoform X2 [Amborella trichopoda]|uniref:U3 small nucleolar RNA-associated protein 4 homolog isoform X2 n=1 Tax=Amborella trichopoda TaxID=13333 RepID=UPI0005D34738|nr:U3 small nucleolar RNA-associated protein 4 homolog isoform X2 [Amborella trichopoda]|eukprot:XP_011628033.1 U3 small nucleolar RNA-associated protein 4 homolog isoform X2 [Amborella trichopoda]